MDKAFKAKKMGQNSDFTTLSQEVIPLEALIIQSNSP
jgi:hypothetical protein